MSDMKKKLFIILILLILVASYLFVQYTNESADYWLAFDAQTGELLWSADFSAFNNSQSPNCGNRTCVAWATTRETPTQLVAWSTETGDILWTWEIPDGAADTFDTFFSPTDDLYFSITFRDEPINRLFALNPNDGSVRWQRDFDWVGETYANGKRIVTDPELFFLAGEADGTLTLHALNSADGSTRWQVANVADIYFLDQPNYDNIFHSELPLAATSTSVLVPTETALTAYSQRDGSQLWQVPLNGEEEDWIQLGDHFYYVDFALDSADIDKSVDSIVALDGTNGELHWRVPFQGSWQDWRLTATGLDDAIYLLNHPYGDEEPPTDLIQLSAQDGMESWRRTVLFKSKVPRFGHEAVVSAGTVLMIDAEQEALVGVDAADGSTIRFSHDIIHIPSELQASGERFFVYVKELPRSELWSLRP